MIFFLLTLSNLTAKESIEPYSGWLETETEHFRIIYEEKSTESVVEITGFCEDVYNSVTSFFDSYPEKIILVVHDRIDAANGSFYPAPPHINLYISRPSTLESGAKVDNWLRFLLTHELTHYVNMTIEKGLFFGLSRFMGKSVSTIPGGLMPGWAIEGIAVKLESDLTGGGRGNNPFFEIFSKALILEGKLFSWKQAAYSSYHPPLSRIYIGGYIINDYMARSYGNDIFVKIYREFLKFPLLGFNHYVKKITGDSISTIFTNMKLTLKQKYSTIEPVQGNLISPDEESDYYLPEISTSGWIVYRETADREPALVLIDPDSKEETILVKTRLTDYTSFSASGNGALIVFAALDIDGKHPAGLVAMSDLYIFDRNSSKTQRITFNSHLRQPAMSPDGLRIVAVQKNGQYTRLVEVDIITGGLKVLFEKRRTSVFNPGFSPDGKQIVFTTQNNRKRSILLLKNDGVLTDLSNNISGNAYNPNFHNNGNIIFISDRDGTPELFEIDTTVSGMPEKIYSDPVGIFEGVIWNNKIIYSTYSHRGYTLRTAPYLESTLIDNDNSNKAIPMKSETFHGLQKTGIELKTSTMIQEDHKRYRDTPKLIVFSPIPFYIDPIYESSQIFGPGITAFFQSILGKSVIFTTVTLDTTMLQPGGSFDFSYDWGPVRLDYSLLQGFSETSNIYNAIQTSRQQLIFNIPIISRKNLGKANYFGLFTGVTDEYSIISNKNFSFFSPEPDANTVYKNNAFQIFGTAWALTGIKSRRDTIPPLQINSSISFYTPLTPAYLNKYALKSTNSINVPSPIDHQVFRFSSRITYSGLDTLKYLNNPRGFSIPGTNNVELLGSAEYLFTITTPDWPILGGLSLQGISGSIHVEKIFTVKDTKLEPEENFYAGMEFILLGNYVNAFESAGFGISYRFIPDTKKFSPDNLGIYLFIGTNSFK